MKHKYLLTFLCCLLLSSISFGQILNETFDSDSSFTKSETFFNDGSSDYFGIYDSSGTDNDFDNNTTDNTPSGMKTFTGFAGKYLVGEDLDGEGNSSSQTLTWSNLNISGYTNLTFAIDVAASNGFDAADEITLAVNIDGNGYTNLTSFSSSGSNEFPSNGTETLSLTMQKITGNIAQVGSTLDVKLTVKANSGSEEFAIDNIIIDGSASSNPTVGFDAATSTETETNTSFSSANIPITLSNYNGTPINMEVSVTGGTYEASDYTFASPTALSFTQNGTQNITVTINEDTDDYDDETIVLTLTQTSNVSGLVLSQQTHTLTILEDEIAPTVGFDAATSTETETDATFTSANIPISVANYSGSQIDVSVAVTGGTAESGDYTFISQTLSFTENGTQNITVIINEDTDDYDDETIIFTLTETSAVTGLIISQSTHTLTITEDESAPEPTAGSVIITEVLDSDNGFNNDYLELYNNSSETVSLSTSKLIRLDASTGNSQYVFDFGTDETNSSNDVLIPAYGFLIIARGSDRDKFNADNGITLASDVSFNGGHTNLYFGTGRRWSLKTGGTPDTNDGTLIDDTLVGVGSSKDYRNIFTNAFVTGSTSEGTPGALEYLVYAGGAWVNATAMDASTGTKDVYFYDDYSISANVAANTIGINTGKTVTANTATQITVNSDLTVNGNFTLNSGASLIVDGSSTGNVTFKKTLDTDNWYLMSVPVSGEDLADIQTNNSLASGAGGNVGLSNYSNDIGSAWLYITATSSAPVDSGIGIGIKLASPGDFIVHGSAHTADVNTLIEVGTRDSYNLVGNPYLASVSVSELLNETNNANLLDELTIWLWDQAQDSYVQKNLINDLEVAPGQGFFVKTGGVGNFSFKKNMQSHAADTFQKGGANRTRVQLQMTDGTANSSTDLVYLDGVTTGWDNGYDSSIFDGIENSFQLYTQALANSNGRKLGIQSLPDNNFEEMIVPIGVKATAGKALTFAMNATNLPEGLMVFLEDRLNGTKVRLDEAGSSYEVTLDANQNGVGRFYLITTASETLSVDDATLSNAHIFMAANRTLKVTGLNSEKAQVKVHSILGKTILDSTVNHGASIQIELPNAIQQGIYIVSVSTENGRIHKKLFIQ